PEKPAFPRPTHKAANPNKSQLVESSITLEFSGETKGITSYQLLRSGNFVHFPGIVVLYGRE
ncbi:hypothetical protein N8194_01015, partial [Akkermansiaceae bacterium]|nr:hypothetical protein [Akkermansiaceae bacterium]